MGTHYGLGDYSPATIYMRDYVAPGTKAGEPAHFAVQGAVLTAANFDAQQDLWNDGSTGGVVPKVQALTLGLITSWEYGNLHVSNLAPGATSKLAQRENKLLIFYQDQTTYRTFRVTLPTIDLSLLTFLYEDYVNIAAGTEMIAFVAAFNAFVVSPDAGNAVLITGAQFVGRNN